MSMDLNLSMGTSLVDTPARDCFNGSGKTVTAREIGNDDGKSSLAQELGSSGCSGNLQARGEKGSLKMTEASAQLTEENEREKKVVNMEG